MTASPDDEQRFPLSVEQSDYLGLGRKGYGAIPAYAEITGPVRLDVLTEAARHVIARHEPLRMRLDSSRDSQVFLAPDQVPPRWTVLPVAGRDDLSRHLVADLDPGRDGALRLLLLRENEDRAHMLALLDHLACDGWSSRLFLRELWSAYRAIASGAEVSLPPISRGYSDYVLAQRGRASRSAKARDYWRDRVGPFAESSTGLRPSGPARDQAGRADLATTVSPDRVHAAVRLADALRVSPNTLPLASVVLAAWSMADTDSIALSFIYAGRDVPGVRPLIGVFHRHVALLIEGIRDGNLAQYLTGVSRSVFDALRYSRAPFSARDFNAEVQARRGRPCVDVLYNQIPSVFGRSRASRPLRVDDRTTVQTAGVHFWPSRWESYAEPRIRLIFGPGIEPNVQAIFNAGLLAESDAACLIDRTVAVLEAMSVESGDIAVPEFVELALSGHDIRCTTSLE